MQIATKSYLNFGIGAVSIFENENIGFKTGVSAYNITNPSFFASPLFDQYKKRFRIAIQNSFIYHINPLMNLRFNYLIWQEHLYVNVYDANDINDNQSIQDNVFDIAYDRKTKQGIFSFELAERSQKNIIGTVGILTNNKMSFNLTYEKPINNSYYDIAHLEIGIKVLLGK